MTEEEIKQQMVLPRLLRRLGYRLLQVSREASVRTGSSIIRADLVFYDGGTPYLVVETKAPDKITAESVLQAESYAILLHAPYFLVTDGRRWHWYQTGKDGGGSSKFLDHEILPRHGRSRLFLGDVDRQPPPAPRPAYKPPAPAEPAPPSALPVFLKPSPLPHASLPPRIELPRRIEASPLVELPLPPVVAAINGEPCAAVPGCLSPYHHTGTSVLQPLPDYEQLPTGLVVCDERMPPVPAVALPFAPGAPAPRPARITIGPALPSFLN